MFHKACGSEVMADISEMFRFVSRIILGKSYLLARRGMANVSNEITETKFFCPSCDKNIPETEVIVRCFECGKELTLENSYKGTTNSYIFCDKHQEVGSKTLSSLTKRISIKTS